MSLLEQEKTENIPLDLSLVTYNIHSGVGSDGRYSIERISAVLDTINADLVCLQECEVNHVDQTTRLWSERHNDDQPQQIARLAGYEHVAFAPAVRSVANRKKLSESFGVDKQGEFGIAILSKYPILEKRILKYSPYGRKTPRNAIACRIDPYNGTTTSTMRVFVWVVCTHLGVNVGGEQLQQARELRQFIQSSLLTGNNEKDTVVLLGGDLNCLRWFAAVKELESFMTNCNDSTDGTTDPAGTFPSTGWILGGLMKLDYLLYCHSLPSNIICRCKKTVVHMERDGVAASDHRPFSMSISIG